MAALDFPHVRQRRHDAAGKHGLLLEPHERICFDHVAAGCCVGRGLNRQPGAATIVVTREGEGQGQGSVRGGRGGGREGALGRGFIVHRVGGATVG